MRVLSVVLPAVLVVVAVAAGMTLRSLDGRYGPIGGGSFSRPASDHELVSGTTYDRLASAPGASATLVASLSNSGSHPVQITSITPPPNVSDVQWSVYHLRPGGNIAGVATPWRSFPATIPANGTIRLLFTVHKPQSCTANTVGSGMTVTYDGSLLVHWKSLLRTHTTSVSVLVRPIRVC